MGYHHNQWKADRPGMAEGLEKHKAEICQLMNKAEQTMSGQWNDAAEAKVNMLLHVLRNRLQDTYLGHIELDFFLDITQRMLKIRRKIRIKQEAMSRKVYKIINGQLVEV